MNKPIHGEERNRPTPPGAERIATDSEDRSERITTGFDPASDGACRCNAQSDAAPARSECITTDSEQAMERSERVDAKTRRTPDRSERIDVKADPAAGRMQHTAAAENPPTKSARVTDRNQEMAVHFEHPNILVSAGAGTGKTESMTNRVVRKILEHYTIGEILVLTFTNAAAAEMKGRIEEKLRAAAMTQTDPDLRRHILSELAAVDNAHIQTFHSFCSDIIREHHHLSEISPDFYVLSERERADLLDRAFLHVFTAPNEPTPNESAVTPEGFEPAPNESAVTPEGFEPTPNESAVSREGFEASEVNESAVTPQGSRQARAADIAFDLPSGAPHAADRYYWFRHFDRPGAPHKFKQAVLALLGHAENSPHFAQALADMNAYTPEHAARIQTAFAEILAREAAAAEQLLAEYQLFAEHAPDLVVTGKSKTAKAFFAQKCDDFRNRLGLALQGEPLTKPDATRIASASVLAEPIEAEICGVCYHTMDEYYAASKEKASELRAAIESLKDLAEIGRDLTTRLDFYSARYRSFARMVQRTKDVFTRMKRERGFIDFSDQEHIAYELLCIDEVRDAVSGRFRLVFVDENQDSSEIQEAIIQKAAYRAQLFKVGDIKQSIYGFRNASPELFERQMKESLMFDSDCENPPSDEALAQAGRVRIPLNTNFRTVQPILDAVNEVFAAEMPEYYDNATLRNGLGKAGHPELPPVRLVEISVHPDGERREGKYLGANEAEEPSGAQMRRVDAAAHAAPGECAEPRGTELLTAESSHADLAPPIGEPPSAESASAESPSDKSMSAESRSAESGGAASCANEAEAWSNEEAEAHYVAREILRIRETERRIFGASSGFKDFAVLHRSMGANPMAYRNVFARYGIPLEVQVGDELAEFPEVRMVIAAIRGILNPYCEVDFVAALMSPFFGFTVSEMYRLSRIAKQGGADASLSYCDLFMRVAGEQGTGAALKEGSPAAGAALASAAEPGGEGALAHGVGTDVSQGDREAGGSAENSAGQNGGASSGEIAFDLGAALCTKMASAWNTMSRLRAYSHYLSAYEFLWRLYDTSGYFDRMAEYQGGAYRQDNLIHFADLVRGISEPIGEYMEALRTAAPEDKAEISEEVDAVKLITCHKSKGMGFKHVFLCGLGRGFNKKDLRGELIHVRTFGAAFQGLPDEEDMPVENTLYRALQRIGEEEICAEELRVLYVAMTRAKETLTMCRVAKNRPPEHSFAGILERYRYAIPTESVTVGQEPPERITNEDAESTKARRETASEPPARHTDKDGKAGAADTDFARACDCVIENSGDDEAREEGAHQTVVCDEAGAWRWRDANNQTLAEYIPVELRMPNFMKDRSAALEFGRRSHRALELFDFRLLLGAESHAIDAEGDGAAGAAEKVAADAWNGGEENAAETAADAVGKREAANAALDAIIEAHVDEDLRGVRRFLRSDLAMRIAHADAIYKEADYVDFTDAGKVQGIIDLFFIEGDHIVLVDYKTDQFKTEEDIRRLQENYSRQLLRYKELLEKVYRREVSEIYLYMLHGEGRQVKMEF